MITKKKMIDKNIVSDKKPQDSNVVKSYSINIPSVDDNKIFRDFADRFKTWEQIQKPWLYNWR